MPDNNLDFLDYLNDDGNVNLDQINSFLDQVEKADETLQDPNEIQGADEDEYQEGYSDSEGFDEEEEENEPYIDGLEFLNSRNKNTPVQSDDEDDEEEYEEDEDSDEESEGSDNPYAIFAKGLADIGRFEFDEDEDPNSIEWNEETFIEKFDETVDNTAWARMEELATEAYGEEGIRLIEDLFINKVPVHEYLSSFQAQQSVENVDLSNERNQAELIRYYLRSVVGETDEE